MVDSAQHMADYKRYTNISLEYTNISWDYTNISMDCRSKLPIITYLSLRKSYLSLSYVKSSEMLTKNQIM